MSGKSLLDMMIDDASGDASGDAPARPQPAYEPADVISEVPTGRVNHAEERRLAKQIEQDRIAERQRAWQAELAAAAQRQPDAPTELAGFTEGMQFDLRGVGAELDGRWLVHHIDPGPAGDFSRLLVARRPTGGDTVLKFTEPKLLDALHSGLVQRLD